MSSYKITVSTELEDGRAFACKYNTHHYPGNTYGPPESCYPDESEVDEPDYYINGAWVDYKTLTPKLSQLADEMYEVDEDTKKFTYRIEEVDDFIEPDDY